MKKIIVIICACLLAIGTYPVVSFAEENSIQKEIIYTILVDRFNNGDQAFSEQVQIDDPLSYHGGDLKGITVKLDNIKELGFTTISLSPIMDNAEKGYHGYWIEDFKKVEEEFGTLKDLQNLVQEAHKRDMKVVLELVTNYVAKSNPIVNDPDKKDWILPNATIDTTNEPWLENVVKLNQENPEVQAMLVDMANYWLQEADVDGFVLHDADQAQIDFVDTLTSELKKEKPELYFIADVQTDSVPEDLAQLPNIDLVENPELSKQIVNTFSHVDNPVEKLYQTWNEGNTKNGLIYVDNKTMDRFAQVAGENGRDDVNTWQLALVYLLTTPGVASIYQGSEIPMYGTGIEGAQHLVDFNSGDPEMKEVYSKVLALHNEFPVLQYGNLELVGSDHGMSVFKRSYEGKSMYIAINNDSVLRSVSLTDLDSGLQLRGLLGDSLVRELDNGEYKIGLARETADVYIVEENTGLNWFFIAPIVVILALFVLAVIYLGRKQKKQEVN